MIVRFSTLQKRILRALDKTPTRTITSLASRLKSLRPSVSRSLTALKESGYVTKIGKEWELTDEGKEALKQIVLPDKDITSEVRTGGYDEEMVSLTKCACGQTFTSWDFVLSIYRDDPNECPNCKRKLYCSIGIKVYEVEE